jgi:glycosyltransferase involved in cell wall biosynthesis
MSSDSLVSVLMPVYNAGEFLRPALQSIVGQTYKNIEVIIVDDGSTDGCIDTISDLVKGNENVKLISKENGGKSSALNIALDQASGDFYVIQDSDDLSYPYRIERQLKCMQDNPELAAVFVGHDLILNGKRFAPKFEQKSVEDCKEQSKLLQMPGHDAVLMCRMSMVGDMRYDEQLRIGQGVEYVSRICWDHPVMKMGQCLYTYRINYDSAIRKDPNKTIEQINLAFKKICQRRGLDYEKYKARPISQSRIFKHRYFDTHIIPHSMDSVIQLRENGNYREAFRTGMICLGIRLFDPFYYKPLMYCLLPLFVIRKYRELKGSLQ